MSNSIPSSILLLGIKNFAVFVILSQLLGYHSVEGDVKFKVEKTTLPGPQYPLVGLPLFDEQTKGWRILGHPFVLKFQLRCVLMVWHTN